MRTDILNFASFHKLPGINQSRKPDQVFINHFLLPQIFVKQVNLNRRTMSLSSALHHCVQSAEMNLFAVSVPIGKQIQKLCGIVHKRLQIKIFRFSIILFNPAQPHMCRLQIGLIRIVRLQKVTQPVGKKDIVLYNIGQRRLLVFVVYFHLRNKLVKQHHHPVASVISQPGFRLLYRIYQTPHNPTANTVKILMPAKPANFLKIPAQTFRSRFHHIGFQRNQLVL